MPAGRPAFAIASTITWATISHVPGCPGCALTITGQRAANAAIVSVPATEIASGKLLAPNTATGPTPTSIARTSGLGSGCRAGRRDRSAPAATSRRAPSWRTAGCCSSCGRARLRSRAIGSAVSAWARSSSGVAHAPRCPRRSRRAAPRSRPSSSFAARRTPRRPAAGTRRLRRPSLRRTPGPASRPSQDSSRRIGRLAGRGVLARR